MDQVSKLLDLTNHVSRDEFWTGLIIIWANMPTQSWIY